MASRAAACEPLRSTVALFDLPYFDQILAGLEGKPESALAAAFQRHVHWGCFSKPDTVDDSLAAYVAAAEELTARVCRAAGVGDGQRILDVGCGFGGTVEHLCERLRDCRLVGANIDLRQLAKAKREVPARRGHDVAFALADGCQLPFATGAFDAIIALECIFHFKSRKAFFREAARVLRPQGRLVLTDFVLREGAQLAFGQWMMSGAVPPSPFYGPSNSAPPTARNYLRLASTNKMRCISDDDITANTLPTYPAMRRLYREAGLEEGEAATNYLEATAKEGFLQYHILAFAPDG